MAGARLSEPLFLPGTTLGTTYTVEAFLGAGAFGQVYRVTHRYLGRQALKVFPPGGLDPARDFFHEARVLVALTHPNIVRIFDANVVETAYGPLPYLAMEYIDGETIRQMLQRRVRLGLAEANALAEDLCAGLSEAHRLEPALLHLDLTTDNILVTQQGGRLHAKIADFGIAAQVHPITRMARAQGTFYFMAPEMFGGCFEHAFKGGRGHMHARGVTRLNDEIQTVCLPLFRLGHHLVSRQVILGKGGALAAPEFSGFGLLARGEV